ncbi:hypothetical protein [Bacteroides thetaiotaomicron]|uniref:hypothetical protein n=1 Tax=Bacteroides thetaiotaomicron TaxID=818 RepID=UPI0039C4542C
MNSKYKEYKAPYILEKHPFEAYIPEKAKTLIIGTFPTRKENRKFEFYYANEKNMFWDILGKIFNFQFHFDEGMKAVNERKEFLKDNLIGITDMHLLCYRRKGSSSDEDILHIKLQDIFFLLSQYPSINRLILTSRTEYVGALGLLKIYFMQQDKFLEIPQSATKLIKNTFIYEERTIKIFVPYSTSPKVIKDYGFDSILDMYKQVFSD